MEKNNQICLRRRSLNIILVLMLSVLSPFSVLASTGNGDLEVHITETGKCYHTAGCGALHSDYSITLEEAYIRGYQRCSRCNPPEYTGTAIREYELQKSQSGTSSSSSSFSLDKNSSSTMQKNSKSDENAVVSNQSKYSFNIESCILVVIVLFSIICLVKKKYEESKSKKENLRRDAEKKRIEEIQKNERRIIYESACKGRSIQEIVGAPPNVNISRNGKVSDQFIDECHPFGSFTVFVSPNGGKFHKSITCQIKPNMKIAHRYAAIQAGYKACLLCSLDLADEKIPDWFLRLPEVVKLIQEFGDPPVS